MLFANTCVAHSRIVLQSWRLYFENVENGLGPGQAYVSPPFAQHTGGVTAAPRAGDSGAHSDKSVLDAIKVDNLIRAYQVGAI